MDADAARDRGLAAARAAADGDGAVRAELEHPGALARREVDRLRYLLGLRD